jgi:hypothetical protein
MPKGQKKENANNKPKLSVKEKAEKKAAKKASKSDSGAVANPKK